MTSRYENSLRFGCLLAALYGGGLAVLLLTHFTGRAWSAATVRAVGRQGDELVAAVRKFERQTGGLPESLGELVPAHLPALPDRLPGVGGWAYSRFGASSFFLSCHSTLRSECLYYDCQAGRWRHVVD